MHTTDETVSIAAKLLEQGEMEMSKRDNEMREMLHKYRKQAQELLAVIEESKRKDRERLDAQAKAEARQRVAAQSHRDGAQAKAEARQRVAAQSHRDGTKLPVRQGKSSARAHVLFAGQAPGDTAMTNIPQLKRVRVTFPKD